MRKPRTEKVIISNEARVLRQMRAAQGLTMRQAGALIGKSDSLISQIENGRMDVPKGAHLERLLVAYGGIKVKSFYERVRTFKIQLSPKDELHDLVERMQSTEIDTILSVARTLLSRNE